MNAYVLDTSALIGAWVRTYPPASFPNFWDHLDATAQQGRIVVPEEVVTELKAKQDELLTWVRDREEWLKAPTTRAVMDKTRAVLERHPGLTQPSTGRGRADPFVIATAWELGMTVVTEERGGSDAKPKIPSVCKLLGIDCLSVVDLIRREGWTF